MFWRFMIAGALRYPWVRMTEGCEAASVWIPPGGTEIAPEDEAQLVPLLEELVGARAEEVIELLRPVRSSTPQGRAALLPQPARHHPSHSGRGIGMGLLAENLARIDLERMPAYLESSNPANNHRYQRYGFEKIGEFHPPGSNTPVTTMWRDAR